MYFVFVFVFVFVFEITIFRKTIYHVIQIPLLICIHLLQRGSHNTDHTLKTYSFFLPIHDAPIPWNVFSQ